MPAGDGIAGIGWPQRGTIKHKKKVCLLRNETPARQLSPVGMPRRGVRLLGLVAADATENHGAPRRCAPTNETPARQLSPVGMPRRGVRLVDWVAADATERPLSVFYLSHFVFFIFFLIGLSSLEAKPEKETPITPSFAKPVKAAVLSGGTVQIPLCAVAPVRGTKYLLRTQPARGVLGEILTTEDGLASISYRHNAQLGIGADSFTYAVQSPGAAVSARATVAILVSNRPAQVEAPSEVDFGSVPVGSSSRRVVTLRNSGGENFRARIQLPSPWESALGHVEIPAGGSADVPIDFSPDTARASSGTWFLEGETTIETGDSSRRTRAGGSQPGSLLQAARRARLAGASEATAEPAEKNGFLVTLTGAGFVVLEVTPSFLKLQPGSGDSSRRDAEPAEKNGFRVQAAADGRRSAMLAVRNKTGNPVEVAFICPPDIQPITPLTIPAGEHAMVDVEAAGTSGGRATLTVKEKRVTATVELLIPPAPARLAFEPSAVDFGAIIPGTSASREITLTNSGGTPGVVEISAPDWIRTEPSRALIKPDEHLSIRLEAIGTRPGSLRGRIAFKSGDKLTEIVVSASVKAATTPTPNPAAPNIPAAPTLNLTETRQQALRVTGIFQENGFVAISWQDPNPDPRTYRFESLQITSEASLARQAALATDAGSEKFSPEEFAAERLKFTKLFEQASKNDKVVKIWSPLENVGTHESGDGKFDATFPVPPNHQVLRIRISSVLADGSTSPVKCEIRIPLEQPPARQWPVKTILLSLAALAAAAFLVRKLKR